MAFIHGKNTAVFVNGSNLSSYFNDSSVSQDVEVAETTTFGTDAKTYITGLRDGTMSADGMFDGALGAVDNVLSGIIGSTAADVVSMLPEGAVAGKPSYSAAARETSYEVSSPVGDVVSASMEVQATGGIDRGLVLIGLSAVSTVSNSSSIDNAAGTSNGGVGYLHVTSNTRDGSAAFSVQDSADNITFADLVTFTSVPTLTTGGERIAVSGSVGRYVRTEVTPGGSSGSVTYTMAFARK